MIGGECQQKCVITVQSETLGWIGHVFLKGALESCCRTMSLDSRFPDCVGIQKDARILTECVENVLDSSFRGNDELAELGNFCP